MNLVVFTQDAYKKLKSDVSINRENYDSDNFGWLETYFLEHDITDYVKTSSIFVPTVELEFNGNSDANKNADDFTNTKLLYGAYKDKITPLQASDPCLWTALSHMCFSKYINQRWKTDNGVNVVQRYFATAGRSSLTYYNAIARLWWSGYLTYDSSKESSNPWELTEVLFSAQQVQKDLFDQPFSMNKTTVKGLLSALKRIQRERGDAATTIFRKCCDSFLNHYGAVAILDCLDAEEIEEIAYKYMHDC